MSFSGPATGRSASSVKFSELFGDKNTLILYSFMFGPNWDKPCPSCTSLMDGFDRDLVLGQRRTRRSPRSPRRRPRRSMRGRRSAAGRRSRSSPATSRRSRRTTNARSRERRHAVAGDAGLHASATARFFISGRRRLTSNHVDTVWPYWNLMDFTPEGRPDRDTPPQKFRSRFLEEHYLEGQSAKV